MVSSFPPILRESREGLKGVHNARDAMVIQVEWTVAVGTKMVLRRQCWLTKREHNLFSTTLGYHSASVPCYRVFYVFNLIVTVVSIRRWKNETSPVTHIICVSEVVSGFSNKGNFLAICLLLLSALHRLGSTASYCFMFYYFKILI